MNADISSLRWRTRRGFLRSTALGAALTSGVPAFLARTWAALEAGVAAKEVQSETGKDGTVLVVVQLAGGNDGLNTVVPYANDDYHRARKMLAIPSKDVLRIDDQLGFHPALRGARALFDEGRLAVVQGVGYPNPNRSHFRSMEIWQTASDAKVYERDGWLGRYFDRACAGSPATVGVSIGRQLPQAFTARRPVGISVEAGGPGARVEAAVEGRMASGTESGRPTRAGDANGPGATTRATEAVLDFLDRTAADARLSSARVREITARVRNEGEYPATRLAQSLKLVARLIRGRLESRVYFVTQSGYDTHTNQAGTQARLLGELGDALKAFADDLRAQGNLSRVLTLTFSEFGRRVEANASGGTDHGAAGLLFLVGQGFGRRLLGRYPGLAPAELSNGDPRHTVDFRELYAGVLEGWLRTPSEPVLGRRFEPLRWG